MHEIKAIAFKANAPQNTVDLLFPTAQHALQDANMLLPLTRAAGLPRYLNLALWKKLLQFQAHGQALEKPSCLGFWYHHLRQHIRGEGQEETHLAFHLLRRTSPDFMSPVHEKVISERTNSTSTMSSMSDRWSSLGDLPETSPSEEVLRMEDLEVIVEDVLHNHPSLDFLAQMPIFQARFLDTVVARMMYRKQKWWDGKMTKRQWLKSGIWESLKALEPGPESNGDVNAVRIQPIRLIVCRRGTFFRTSTFTWRIVDFGSWTRTTTW